MTRWKEYYERTIAGSQEATLEFAISLLDAKLPRTATDCGCGAGRDSAYLLQREFTVDAFDADEHGVEIIRERFEGEPSITVSHNSFLSHDYKGTALTNASLSLFFCPHAEFEASWAKIVASIPQGGVFCGTFLGPRDDWSKGLIHHTEEQVLSLFEGFDVCEKSVREYENKRPEGHIEHRHAIQVVAKKRTNEQARLT